MGRLTTERLVLIMFLVVIFVSEIKGDIKADKENKEAVDDAYKSGYAAAQEKCKQEIYRLQDENESLQEQYEEIQYELADSDLQVSCNSGYEKGYAVGIIDGRAEVREEIGSESE